MLINFRCQETQKIWNGVVSKRLPHNIQQVIRRKLRMLNNAKVLDDLRIPPNNKLERLKGERKGQYSIRVNKQWRVCFSWESGNALDVQVIDYH